MPGRRGPAVSPPRLPGFVAGSIVAVTFGTVFVLVNSGGLPRPWPLALRVAGLAVAALLVAGLVRARGAAPPRSAAPAGGFAGLGYWTVVALEAVALFGGLFVINGVLHRQAVSVAWVAAVVGLHFFGLGRLWRMPMYHWLGAVLTALGLAGFVIRALGGSAATVALVSGVGSGLVLYLAVAAVLRVALSGVGRPRGRDHR